MTMKEKQVLKGIIILSAAALNLAADGAYAQIQMELPDNRPKRNWDNDRSIADYERLRQQQRAQPQPIYTPPPAQPQSIYTQPATSPQSIYTPPADPDKQFRRPSTLPPPPANWVNGMPPGWPFHTDAVPVLPAQPKIGLPSTSPRVKLGDTTKQNDAGSQPYDQKQRYKQTYAPPEPAADAPTCSPIAWGQAQCDFIYGKDKWRRPN